MSSGFTLVSLAAQKKSCLLPLRPPQFSQLLLLILSSSCPSRLLLQVDPSSYSFLRHQGIATWWWYLSPYLLYPPDVGADQAGVTTRETEASNDLAYERAHQAEGAHEAAPAARSRLCPCLLPPSHTCLCHSPASPRFPQPPFRPPFTLPRPPPLSQATSAPIRAPTDSSVLLRPIPPSSALLPPPPIPLHLEVGSVPDPVSDRRHLARCWADGGNARSSEESVVTAQSTQRDCIWSGIRNTLSLRRRVYRGWKV